MPTEQGWLLQGYLRYMDLFWGCLPPYSTRICEVEFYVFEEASFGSELLKKLKFSSYCYELLKFIDNEP